MSDTPAEEKKSGFFARLRQGLSRSASSFAKVVTRKKLDRETLDQLEDALIRVDISPDIAKFVLEEISRNRFAREISDPELKSALAKELATILERVRRPCVASTSFPRPSASSRSRRIGADCGETIATTRAATTRLP